MEAVLAVVVQGVGKSNQTNFREICRRFPGDILTKFFIPGITQILFTRWTLPNFSWQLLGSNINA